MASEKQTNANRKNALKSTGPKTPKGKTVTAKNAIKHALLTNQSTIPGESQAEFDRQRDEIFEDFEPVGLTEKLLVERFAIVSWRLRRADRIQTAVMISLYDSLENKPFSDIGARFSSKKDDSDSPPDLQIGKITIKDYTNSKVIERLSMHEHRLENSFFKTLDEIEKVQMIRKMNE